MFKFKYKQWKYTHGLLKIFSGPIQAMTSLNKHFKLRTSFLIQFIDNTCNILFIQNVINSSLYYFRVNNSYMLIFATFKF